MILLSKGMPAQNIHIVKNEENPWIQINEDPSFCYGSLIYSKFHKRFKK